MPAEALSSFINAQLNPAFDWDDAKWLIEEWGDAGPVALKAIERWRGA